MDALTRTRTGPRVRWESRKQQTTRYENRADLMALRAEAAAAAMAAVDGTE